MASHFIFISKNIAAFSARLKSRKTGLSDLCTLNARIHISFVSRLAAQANCSYVQLPKTLTNSATSILCPIRHANLYANVERVWIRQLNRTGLVGKVLKITLRSSSGSSLSVHRRTLHIRLVTEAGSLHLVLQEKSLQLSFWPEVHGEGEQLHWQHVDPQEIPNEHHPVDFL